MLIPFEGFTPRVSPDVFVAPTAVLIGNVVVESGASIWYGAVLRADHGEHGIVVGARTSVQDNAVIHVATERGTRIGNDVTIGHGALLEGCDIEDGALIGMGSIILNYARVGTRALIAAGSVVLERGQIPADTVAAGSPARVKKVLEGASRQWIEMSAGYYVELAAKYRAAGLGLTGSESVEERDD
jgi:carbonic anhydrase/acetyltransferase-like protein (isoleucine patch superfamily)